jgi:zinc D-Ala-D-Ala carboxypeptidase
LQKRQQRLMKTNRLKMMGFSPFSVARSRFPFKSLVAIALSLVLGLWAMPSWAQTPQFRPPSNLPSNARPEKPSPEQPSPEQPSQPETDRPARKIDCSATTISSYYGHLPYAEAPRRELVGAGDGQRLRRGAARIFQQMRSDAEEEGIYFTLVSGFRDRVTQNYLFYGVARQRGQSLQERALVSAPPGYSEHHTGYAFDLGDEDSPGTDLSRSFDDTEAWAWLTKHASEYNLEMSFSKTHPCVSYEPWHWRWVGDEDSLQTFQAARELL